MSRFESAIKDSYTEVADKADQAKPVPDWTQTIKIPVRDTLDWKMHDESLRSALADAAGLAADIPERYLDWWIVDTIDFNGDHFIVTLDAYEADIVN